jgi:hypothetical protein
MAAEEKEVSSTAAFYTSLNACHEEEHMVRELSALT